MGCKQSTSRAISDRSIASPESAARRGDVAEKKRRKIEPTADGTSKPSVVFAAAVSNPSKALKRFNCGGPTKSGDIEPVFADGLLFRIVDGTHWYFYNDTTDYEMHVTWKFGPDSKVEPRSDTKVGRELIEDAKAGKLEEWITMYLVVRPAETKELMDGAFNGYKSHVVAKPLSKPYLDAIAQESEMTVAKERKSVEDAFLQGDDNVRVDCGHLAPPLDEPEPPSEGGGVPTPLFAWDMPLGDWIPEKTVVDISPNSDRHRAAVGGSELVVIEGLDFPPEQDKKVKTFMTRLKVGECAVLPTELTPPAALTVRVPRTASEPADILESCLLYNVPFVDLLFVPSYNTFSWCAFKRPTAFLRPEWRKKICLWETSPDGTSSISPDDVQQGALRDSHIICAICCVAEQPDKICDLFAYPAVRGVRLAEQRALQRREQNIGAYRVTLSSDGWWRAMILDDFLPVVGSTPAFARNREDPAQLWASLLEKAFAKTAGSYDGLVGGDPLEALETLTGAPTLHLDAAFADIRACQSTVTQERLLNKLFTRLSDFDNRGYFITVCTPPPQSRDLNLQYHEVGLPIGTAFSVLKVKAAAGFSLLHVRCPTKNAHVWQGNWGPGSAMWELHPEVAKALPPTDPTDRSCFWITMEDCVRYMTDAGVCLYEKTWFDYRVAGQFERGFPTVSIEIEVYRDVDVVVMLSQKPMEGDSTGSHLAPILLTVASQCPLDYGSGSDLRTYRVQYQTTADPERPDEIDEGAPSGRPTSFWRARNVAMKISLKAHTTYVLAPRIYPGQSQFVSYVLGLLAANELTADVATVSFKRLAPTSRLFDNFWTYDLSSAIDAWASYQFKPPRGHVVTIPSAQRFAEWH